MFHLAAFAGAKTDSTANEACPAVVDNAWTVSANNRYIAPTRLSCFAAQAIHDAITRARINAPSLRLFGLPEINPVTVANVQGTPAVDYYDDHGPTIQQTEEFGVDTSNGAGTVDFAYAALWLRGRKVEAPRGKRTTIVGTASVTQVARGWAQQTITLEQVLPYGRYSVIGAKCVITNGLFFRLIFPNGGQWRPGGPCVATIGVDDPRQLFRSGNSGQWGTFDSTAQPVLETLANTAGAQTATVILDLVDITGGG
jgi:hypothetical protein